MLVHLIRLGFTQVCFLNDFSHSVTGIMFVAGFAYRILKCLLLLTFITELESSLTNNYSYCAYDYLFTTSYFNYSHSAFGTDSSHKYSIFGNHRRNQSKPNSDWLHCNSWILFQNMYLVDFLCLNEHQ